MKEIFERRSIRKFTEEPVSDEDLLKILKAAMRAPSACNEQPWEFIVIKDRETMKAIQKFQRFSQPLNTAACAVVVCGDTKKLKFAEYDFWIQDCSAATQNMLLEIQHLGLGAVWMGLHPVPAWTEACSQLLELPESVIPLGIVAMGHPDQHPEPLDTYKEERIHYEKWSGDHE